MVSSVTQLRPRTGSYFAAIDAFRAARFSTCIGELNGQSSDAAAALRARSFLRLAELRSALVAVTATEASTTRDRAEHSLLRAVALRRLGHDEQAEDAIFDAEILATTSGEVSLVSEVFFYRGLSAFGDGELIDARASCERSLVEASLPQPLWVETKGAIPREHVLGRTEELLGLISSADGQYRDWLKHARTALDHLDRSDIHDVYQEGYALRNLAVLARELDLPHDARSVANRVATLPWTDETARIQFVATEVLAWCFALRGDTVESLSLLRQAADVASSGPERVIIAVNRALIAKAFGHHPMVVEEIQYALRLSESTDWDCASGDDRLALLFLAGAAAPVAVERARRALDRYRSIRNKIEGTYVARVEARVQAEEAYADGLVLRAEGRLDASIGRLATAFETWQRIGHDWRAARAAVELAELNAGTVFRLAVHRELRQRPDSIFATRARLVA